MVPSLVHCRECFGNALHMAGKIHLTANVENFYLYASGNVLGIYSGNLGNILSLQSYLGQKGIGVVCTLGEVITLTLYL